MFPVRYVAASLRVNVLLCKAKVNDVNDTVVPCTCSSDEEVLWFDITIDQVLRMDIFYSTDLHGP